MTHQSKVYIVLLNWNGWKDTLECLESIFRQNYENYQVIVCDNDSQDNSIKHIQEWASGDIAWQGVNNHALAHLSWPAIPKPISFVTLNRSEAESLKAKENAEPLVLIRTGGNLGFAGGNNVGLRYVLQRKDADFVWVLNNDTVVDRNALSEMLKQHLMTLKAGHPNTCGSLVRFYDDPDIVQALGGASFNRWTGVASMTLGRFMKIDANIDHESYISKLDYITGCTWLLPVDYLQEVGLMEESYFLYYEEIDWVYRAKGQYKLTYSDKSYVYHKEGSSLGSKSLNKSSSLLSEFYMTKSKILFTKKFNKICIPTVYMAVFLQAINRFRQGFPRKTILILKVLFGKKKYP